MKIWLGETIQNHLEMDVEANKNVGCGMNNHKVAAPAI